MSETRQVRLGPGYSIRIIGHVPNPVYLGAFTREVNDPDAKTEVRWNEFATALYQAGLEPVEDEPYWTEADGHKVTDFYNLRPIEEL